ncbi:triosephosphate isomerase [Nitrincola sp. A-D6]|uniref:triose-phosphate isomerase n=1 Tax=Nitrincola sp. A-D6 TaxID=1545442 RepID=UPI00051FB5A9|nr:triose-phosphate isomerase [Nitrincola sp. A-D6]KGK41381.1 triosephosphate isomerase [Nitrincola sp. A-D6]
MRKALVAGNWKMHGRIEQNRVLVDALLTQLSGLPEADIDVVICPPQVYLAQIKTLLQGSAVALGSQDVSRFAADGAHTGDSSAAMLNDLGVRYVLIGHSERRHEQSETDEQVAAKIASALLSGLTPIVCVGESLEQRESGQVTDMISAQLKGALSSLQRAEAEKLVIAYEPVWAIGTGKTATSEQAQEVHAFIREYLSSAFDEDLSQSIRLLYGGSVNSTNAALLFEQVDIDGGLIGGASLKSDEFTAICRAAALSTING